MRHNETKRSDKASNPLATLGSVACVAQKVMSTEATTNNVSTEVKTASHKHNDVELSLVLRTTKAREGKVSLSYYDCDVEALDVIKTSTVDGKEVKATDETATMAVWSKLFGFTALRDALVGAKLSQNLKATQLDAGKDKYSLTEKLEYVRAYIDADFGAKSRGGIGITNAMYKEMQTTLGNMAAVTKRLFELGQIMTDSKATLDDKVKAAAEMQVVMAENAKLQAAAAAK
jgi:hypothetical protein